MIASVEVGPALNDAELSIGNAEHQGALTVLFPD